MSKLALSVEELAARWDVHPRTIYNAIAKKQIVALRVGKVIRISLSHVEFLEANGQRDVS